MPAFALNFYSPIVEAQLRSHRKTATIRLGDKSRKYNKGMIVSVLVGARYGPRQHVFNAVIDKVDVKRLRDLSPREIEHDNPEIRRPEEMAPSLPALQQRSFRGHTVIHSRPSSPWRYAPLVPPKRASSRAPAAPPAALMAKADENAALQAGQRCTSSPPHAGLLPGSSARTPQPALGRATRQTEGRQSPSTLRRSSVTSRTPCPCADDRRVQFIRLWQQHAACRGSPAGWVGPSTGDPLGIYRNMLDAQRRARHILPPGQDSRSFHRPWQRSRSGRRGDRDGA